MTGKIRTTNFDAVLASTPNDRLAAVVVSQSCRTISFDGDRREELALKKQRLADKLTMMNFDGVSRKDPQRKALMRQVTLLEAELREINVQKLLAGKKMAPRTFADSFVNEARRLLSKQQFNEIFLAARGALLIPTDPKDMWEPAA